MKTGDYVRTKNGIIGKIESKNLIGYNDWIIDTLYYNNDEIINDWTCGIKEYDIIKSSPNIIDLIEEGDYVNGYLVYEINENCVMVGYKCFKTKFDDEKDFLYQTIYANDIKSIVTKEQFESMEYKVGE